MSHGQHGQRWKFTSFSIQKVARPSGTTLQLAVNSRKFLKQVFFFSQKGRASFWLFQKGRASRKGGRAPRPAKEA